MLVSLKAPRPILSFRQQEFIKCYYVPHTVLVAGGASANLPGRAQYSHSLYFGKRGRKCQVFPPAASTQKKHKSWR